MKKLTIAGLSALLGASAGAVAVSSVQRPKTIQKADHTRKMTVSFFIQNGYKTVAIYGMKELGERLYDELKNSEIAVKYVIDQNADAIYADVDVVAPEDSLEDVDVVVVTAIHYFEEIESMLGEKVDYPIISLEDIIYEI